MDSNNNSANMKLEPGMMCLVIGGVKNLDNIGKLVKLVRFIPKEGIVLHMPVQEDVWEVEGESLSILFKDNSKIYGNTSIAPAKFLMPIRPEEDPLEMSIQSIEDYLDSKQKEKAR